MNQGSDKVVAIGRRPDAEFVDVQPLVSGAKRRVAQDSGNIDTGLIWADQIQGLIRNIPTCADLLPRIVADAEAIIKVRLAQMRSSETGKEDYYAPHRSFHCRG